MLENMDPSANEYFKLKNWIDTFMRIPFDNYCDLNINITDGIDKCSLLIQNSIDILNSVVYGLKKGIRKINGHE